MYASSITGACLFHLNGAQCEIRTRMTQGLSLRCLPIAPTERRVGIPSGLRTRNNLGLSQARLPIAPSGMVVPRLGIEPSTPAPSTQRSTV
jgi:hypothetical protein